MVVLAGGTGGAKLARGMLDVVGGEELVVIANTGDDIEIYGAYVSPDPDLVTFWLADLIDERGWGLREDTFAVMDGLRGLGVEVWFSLGDRDLAIGLERARMLSGGVGLTEAHGAIVRALGVRAAVLPVSEQPIRTRVMVDGGWWPFQEFMIRRHGAGPVDAVDFRGVGAAQPATAVLQAIAAARAIVVGPSNPIVSIGPMLAVPGVREALAASPAPVVAVSPLVGGQVLKGPTAEFMAWAGHSLDTAGITAVYAGVIDGLVADEGGGEVPMLETSVLMETPAQRAGLAEQTLEFAAGLTGGGH